MFLAYHTLRSMSILSSGSTSNVPTLPNSCNVTIMYCARLATLLSSQATLRRSAAWGPNLPVDDIGYIIAAESLPQGVCTPSSCSQQWKHFA